MGSADMLKKLSNDDANARETFPTSGDISDLVQRYHGDVYRYAYRLSGNSTDAEDLSQQTFLLAQQRLGQLREQDKAIGWLFAILRSCFLKSRRHRRPIVATMMDFDLESIPAEIDESDIDVQQLQWALDRLPDDFRLAVVMYYFEERSYKEIAAELNISIGTVMSRLSRAKGHLRRHLLQRMEPASATGAQRDDDSTESHARGLMKPAAEESEDDKS